jgi:poly(3-hydroxybutyrate) depolymerase
MKGILLGVTILVAASPAAGAEKITKHTLETSTGKRTYYLFVPERVKEKPAQLIVMLHGSGRDGKILLEHWQGVARTEGIVLAGPDAADRRGWHIAPDGPHFLHDLVEALKKTHPIDPRRVYLFGHSAGAIHGLHLGVLESEYFAAVAAHAGVIMSEFTPFIEQATRKVPIALWVGANDRLFPVDAVRATRNALVSGGFSPALTEIPGHTHDYYGRSSRINKEVWAFLQQHQLAADPKYQMYDIGK